MSEQRSSATALSPCPFCGGPAKLIEANDLHAHGPFVMCDNDECPVYVESNGATVEEACENWNRRTIASAERESKGSDFIDARLEWIGSRARQGLNPPTHDELAAYADGYADAAVAKRIASSTTSITPGLVKAAMTWGMHAGKVERGSFERIEIHGAFDLNTVAEYLNARLVTSATKESSGG